MLNIRNIRKKFPILNNNSLIYFDSASTTQKPINVINKVSNFYKNINSNVHRASYEIAESATLEYENSRNEIANFLNCSANETSVSMRCPFFHVFVVILSKINSFICI